MKVIYKINNIFYYDSRSIHDNVCRSSIGWSVAMILEAKKLINESVMTCCKIKCFKFLFCFPHYFVRKSLTLRLLVYILVGRSQCVYIDDELSEVLSVDVGVPQGSVLGGPLYVLLIGDLPQDIHEEEKYDMNCESKYNTHCLKYGGLAAFDLTPPIIKKLSL